MTVTKLDIAIIGGGIAGLALAAGLIKQPHLTVHVYEAVSQYSDVGAGLALHQNAIKAMTLIGPEVCKAYFNKALSMTREEDEEMTTQVILAHGPHAGELVAELGRAKGRKTVSRADLLDGFRALLPPGCIIFNKRLIRITETDHDGILLTFTDETTTSTTCVLGADGIHSITRSHLLGPSHPSTPPKNHDSWQIYRTLLPTSVALTQIPAKYTTSVPILLGPNGHINIMPLNKNTRVSAGVAVRGSPLTPSGLAPPLDPALYTSYTPEAQQIVRLVAKDTSASWSAADHDPAPFYSRGSIAMLGDAAHAALPFAGNGAAQALEDCAVLTSLFAHVHRREDIVAALRAYDIVRRPRSQAVVELARKFGRVYAFAEGGMHEDLGAMREFFREAGAFTNEFDVGGQNEDALGVYWRLRGWK